MYYRNTILLLVYKNSILGTWIGNRTLPRLYYVTPLIMSTSLNESPNLMDDAEGSPVVAYALATSALLFAACLMCICFMCCAKWWVYCLTFVCVLCDAVLLIIDICTIIFSPEWRRQRRERSAKEQLLKHCSKVW